MAKENVAVGGDIVDIVAHLVGRSSALGIELEDAL